MQAVKGNTMLCVLTPNDSLTVVMSGAAATTNPTYSVIFDGEGVLNESSGSLSGATAVTLVAAPKDGRRVVKSVRLNNVDTAAVTLTLRKIENGTTIPLVSRTLQPNDVLRSNEEGHVVLSASTVSGAGTVGTGTTASEQGSSVVHKTVLTMDDVLVTVGNTTGISFGGTKIYDFPAGRILVLGVTADDISFDVTNAGNVTPIAITHGGDISIGTTAPTDGTLTNADVDLLPSTSIDPISAGVAGAALAASAQFDGTATAKDAFFNIIIDDADVADGASDVLMVNGVVTIHWINLGDY